MDLSKLPVDVFIQQITYLPFKNVVNVCSTNKNLNSYCSDPKYNTNWKMLIDNTFGGIYNYQNNLKLLWDKLNLSKDTYNYLVYTQLVKLLDPITQLMIYYRQGDTKSFDNEFHNSDRFLALFLLGKRDKLEKYFSPSGKYRFDEETYYPSFIKMLKGVEIDQDTLNEMLGTMSNKGSIKGIEYLIRKGADIHANNEYAVQIAAKRGHLEVIKYLVERGADIYKYVNSMLKNARVYGHLKVVEYIESVLSKK